MVSQEARKGNFLRINPQVLHPNIAKKPLSIRPKEIF
jgi:hypothetical protein